MEDQDMPQLEEFDDFVTLIFRECSKGNLELNSIKSLLEKNGEINCRNKDNHTPLQVVCSNPSISTDVLKFFIENKALVNINNSDNSPLHKLCQTSKNLDLIKFLVEFGGANVNAFGKFKYYPLHKACANKEIAPELFDYLIENKADIGSKDKWGW